MSQTTAKIVGEREREREREEEGGKEREKGRGGKERERKREGEREREGQRKRISVEPLNQGLSSQTYWYDKHKRVQQYENGGKVAVVAAHNQLVEVEPKHTVTTCMCHHGGGEGGGEW